MDRLSTLDAEFLHIEDGVAHMHIAGVCVFGDPPPRFDELSRMVAAKLHLIPRYRQRVRSVPIELGRPVWVDDPHFDLGYHLRHTALPSPGGEDEFHDLMGRLMSQPLDRDRPLWETWLVDGLEGGRWALVFKIHHCMVDGIAGVELLEVLLDLEPRETIGPAQAWSPQPEPSGLSRIVDAWGGLVAEVVDRTMGVPGIVRHPLRAIRSANDVARGACGLAANLRANAPTSIEGTIGPHRTWAHAAADLDDVRSIRAAFGGTVNDVVLAAVTGAYRTMLAVRGEDPSHASIRSMVPVSVRHEDEHGVPDNRVSVLFLHLPVELEDPIDRLAVVRERMTELKASHMAEAGEAITNIGNLAPPMVVGAATRLAQRTMRGRSQHIVNTVTTNVPGPQFTLFCLGREMLEYWPFVGISHGVRVSTAILSYNGRLFFGVTGDRASMPDVGILADAIAEEISRLAELASDGPPTVVE